MFVETRIDPRIETALPMLAKIQQEAKAMKEADIFESWAARLVEGTWALPDTPEKMTTLKTWFSQPQPLGPDAENVTDVLYPLLGDDALFDQLAAMAAEDPDADAIPIVQAWVTRNKDQSPELSELAASFETAAPVAPPAPEAPPATAAPPAPATAAPPAPATAAPTTLSPMEEGDNPSTFESLQSIKHLAGMSIQESRIEESSEYTYEKIGQTLAQQQPHLDANSDQFAHAVYHEMIELGMTPKSANFKLNYDEDFLSDVASAFHHYVRHQSDGQTVGQVMSQVGTRGLSGRPAPLTEECNYTMENEYCPVHGLEECGTMGMFESELARIKSLSSFK
jgi:hypothetical protein